MKLYFVRHGETDWNVSKRIQGKTDVPLNENGLLQAKMLAERLADKQRDGELHVVHAYTSPHIRAAKTARTVAEALGIPCTTLEDLREMDFGEWEGLNWPAVMEKYGDVFVSWDTKRRYTHVPGGESYNEVLGRTVAAMKQILSRETEDVLVVSHSAILMSLRCYMAELPFEQMVKNFKTKNTEVVEIEGEAARNVIARFEAGE